MPNSPPPSQPSLFPPLHTLTTKHRSANQAFSTMPSMPDLGDDFQLHRFHIVADVDTGGYAHFYDAAADTTVTRAIAGLPDNWPNRFLVVWASENDIDMEFCEDYTHLTLDQFLNNF